ncbi:MAG: hypothetical protein ABWZ88_04860 [Variovorax sp.]
MNDYLLPLPRLNAKQLKALANTVRDQAPGNDQVADSVAAALESVSRRRSERLQTRDAAMALSIGLVRAVLNACNAIARLIASSRPARQAPARVVARSARRAATSVALDPTTVQSALRAAELGVGVAPDLCDALVARGWLEWVDFELETSIDMNDPRSMLRMTPAGQAQLARSVSLTS